jgi:hypothetical protein
MKKISIVTALVVLLGAGCTTSAPPVAAPSANVNQQASAVAPSADAKFVDQPYYKNAYLISGATMDDKTKTATAGFAITKTALSDGTTQIDLKALNSGYNNQKYVLGTGEQLYFIDGYLGDDDINNNADNIMRDDTAVVVDANGNVVNTP